MIKNPAMNLLITLVLLALVATAYAAPGEKYIDVQHDSVRGVTCWILNDTAISCLPDSQLRQQGRPDSQGRSEGMGPAEGRTQGGVTPVVAPGERQHRGVPQL